MSLFAANNLSILQKDQDVAKSILQKYMSNSSAIEEPAETLEEILFQWGWVYDTTSEVDSLLLLEFDPEAWCINNPGFKGFSIALSAVERFLTLLNHILPSNYEVYEFTNYDLYSYCIGRFVHTPKGPKHQETVSIFVDDGITSEQAQHCYDSSISLVKEIEKRVHFEQKESTNTLEK
jgi:hypothetical protein